VVGKESDGIPHVRENVASGSIVYADESSQ
jgi:hypothetical protein